MRMPFMFVPLPCLRGRACENIRLNFGASPKEITNRCDKVTRRTEEKNKKCDWCGGECAAEQSKDVA